MTQLRSLEQNALEMSGAALDQFKVSRTLLLYRFITK